MRLQDYEKKFIEDNPTMSSRQVSVALWGNDSRKSTVGDYRVKLYTNKLYESMQDGGEVSDKLFNAGDEEFKAVYGEPYYIQDTAPINKLQLKTKVEPVHIVTSTQTKPNCKHILIPDLQVKPDIDMSYLTWIGKYIAEKKPDVIINIGDHFDLPSLSSYDKGTKRAEGKHLADDIEAGIIGMNLLLEPIADLQYEELELFGEVRYKPKMVFTIGNHECLKDDVDVLVKGKGFIPIKEVAIEDEVYTLNEDGVTGVWQNVKNYIVKQYDGDMYKWSSSTFHLDCTANHRIYYKSSGGNIVVKKAKDMLPNFKVVTSALPLSNEEYNISDEMLQLSAWACTDAGYNQWGGVTFYQRASNVYKIKTLLDKCNIPYRETIRDRDIKEICGKLLKSKPEAGHELALTKESTKLIPVISSKEVPEWVYKLSKRQFDIFLEVVVDADGSIPTRSTKSRVVYGTKRFCDSLQAVCVIHGWRASLVEYRPTHWRLNLTNRLTAKQESHGPEVYSYKGLVYCLVTDNSNFMIRSNGKCHFTGNCRLSRHLNANPELTGLVSYADFRLEDNGWEVYDFLEPAVVNGVTYIHYLPNPMTGKPLSGTAHNILSKAGCSVTMGHAQKLDIATRHLPNGQQQWALVCGAGYPHDEFYKSYVGNSHFRGIIVKHGVNNGNYNPMVVSLDYLEKRYG